MKGTIWCLHGAVGMAADWRGLEVAGWMVKRVNLWRFLACCPMPLWDFAKALNGEAGRALGRNVLVGYSMGGRLALHALLAGGPWSAAVLVSTHPGMADEGERGARLAHDAEWAARALRGDWPKFLHDWNAQRVLRKGKEGGALALADRRELRVWRSQVARSFIDWSLGRQEALGGRMREISCPSLWVTGEEDEKFRVLVPSGMESWTAPGSGHRVPWESSVFPAKLGEFLEQAVS